MTPKVENSGPNPQALVAAIAHALIGKPDDTFVDPYEENGEVILELEVPEEDVGKLIGRQGRTARAIRNILAAVSEKAGKRYVLEIVE
ncbi:MAG TPA: KH domain-containing protein [Terriglobales bacterium]|nr:KH domain-containing protein [Terriglobales bacterium]